MSRRWWKSRDGHECTSVRIEVTLTRSEFNFLAEVAKQEGEDLQSVLRGCFSEGLEDLRAREPLSGREDEE